MASIDFNSLIEKLVAAPEAVRNQVENEMKKSAVMVRDEAVKKFGTYQPGVGDLPAWAKLKKSTISQKEEAGSEGDDPLIGHSNSHGKKIWEAPLSRSIGYKVDGLNAAVGTDDPLGEIHEYGAPDTSGEHAKSAAGKNHTSVIPPRPFLRPALYENQDKIKDNIKEGLQDALKDI